MPDQSPASGSGRDITILVPAYQCAGQLAEHSRSLQKYRDLGCPVMWVVSPSPDGSEKVAEQICKQTGDRLLLSPPGLYESWNFGIARVKTDFFGISTIGDSYLNTGLLTMADLLRRTAGDLCFSPPFQNNADGTLNTGLKKWPVQQFQSRLDAYSGTFCPAPLLIFMQVNSGLSCVLGSWASILARTAVVQKHPFPVDYGHYGDTAWFFRHLVDLRIVFWREPVAYFQFHGQPESRASDGKKCEADFRRLALVLFRQARLRGVPLGDLFRRFARFYSALVLLNRTRGTHPKRFWWLNPYFLRLRYIRIFQEKRLANYNRLKLENTLILFHFLHLSASAVANFFS